MSEVTIVEIEVPEGQDPELDTLSEMAQGMPYVFVFVDTSGYPALDIKMRVGNGVADKEVARNLLLKAVAALS